LISQACGFAAHHDLHCFDTARLVVTELGSGVQDLYELSAYQHLNGVVVVVVAVSTGIPTNTSKLTFCIGSSTGWPVFNLHSVFPVAAATENVYAEHDSVAVHMSQQLASVISSKSTGSLPARP